MVPDFNWLDFTGIYEINFQQINVQFIVSTFGFFKKVKIGFLALI